MRVISIVVQYATPFSPITVEISVGNIYYGIDLTNIAIYIYPTVEFINLNQIQYKIKMATGIINTEEKRMKIMYFFKKLYYNINKHYNNSHFSFLLI